jgi:hypothetical protein
VGVEGATFDPETDLLHTLFNDSGDIFIPSRLI